jgi:hypothetical protein
MAGLQNRSGRLGEEKILAPRDSNSDSSVVQPVASRYRLRYFFSFGATAPIGALAYLHETFRFTSVF